jgi:hypothetical protein
MWQKCELTNYHYYCHFPGLEFIQLPESVEDFVFSRMRREFNSQNSLLLGKLYWNG